MDPTRRQALLTLGIGSLGTLAGNLLAAEPTPASGKATGLAAILLDENKKLELPRPPAKLSATEDNIVGPYYRQSSPFRAKITPPNATGTTLLVKGRVWSLSTRQPLQYAVLDVWQADSRGRYDNDDPARPPAKDVYLNRARLITDETGEYEYETIHPGPYKQDNGTWRPSHVHYMVRALGHKTLITQMYFQGDQYNAKDEFIKRSLIMTPLRKTVNTRPLEEITFDVVLEKA